MAIYQDKKRKTYYVKYYLDGVSNTKRGFRTKKEAKEFEEGLRNGTITKIQNIRFKSLAYDFLSYFKSGVAYGTYQKAKRLIDAVIIPNLHNKCMGDISELDCLKLREFVGSQNYSTSYKNDILWIFKAIFRHAECFYRMKENPAKNIERFRKTTAEKLKRKDKETNIWTEDEFERFLNCVGQDMYKVLFLTLYYTGMRKGEILALKWSDFDGEFISVNKSLTRKTEKGSYEIKDPKNEYSYRDISLNRSLAEYLMEYKGKEMKCIGFKESWYMFGRSKPIAENTLTRVKDRAAKEAGVKRITIHEFRHSHASNLIANGVNIVAVSRRLGHSDINMTLSRYTHLLKKSDKELTDNLEKMFSKYSQNILTV
ncbi:MAG: site-specific integrase [Erysipelotrichaceae bacterium]|nr:site-specific integrase [Erysipelotrichaceae bacterium]